MAASCGLASCSCGPDRHQSNHGAVEPPPPKFRSVYGADTEYETAFRRARKTRPGADKTGEASAMEYAGDKWEEVPVPTYHGVVERSLLPHTRVSGRAIAQCRHEQNNLAMLPTFVCWGFPKTYIPLERCDPRAKTSPALGVSWLLRRAPEFGVHTVRRLAGQPTGKKAASRR